MTSARSGLALALAALMLAPMAFAETKTARRGPARTSAVAQARAGLRDSVARSLAAENLTESVSAYDIAPSLVQLRRYQEAGRRPTVVCVVDLVLQDQRGVLVATVRGSASVVGATPIEAVDAAAHAAVVHIPAALQALQALQ